MVGPAPVVVVGLDRNGNPPCNGGLGVTMHSWDAFLSKPSYKAWCCADYFMESTGDLHGLAISQSSMMPRQGVPTCGRLK